MTDLSTLPAALRLSAIPRWSHRDPVEADNPFPIDDPRHRPWDVATRCAQAALVRLDGTLEPNGQSTPNPTRYRVQLLGLVKNRFSVWARRGLCVVWSNGALRDYEQWLATYMENWLTYVDETCPNVNVADKLRFHLTRQVEHSTTEAKALLSEKATHRPKQPPVPPH